MWKMHIWEEEVHFTVPAGPVGKDFFAEDTALCHFPFVWYPAVLSAHLHTLTDQKTQIKKQRSQLKVI